MAVARNFQKRAAFVSGSENSWKETLEKRKNFVGKFYSMKHKNATDKLKCSLDFLDGDR